MFKVALRGNRWKYGFETAEAAIAYANQIYQKRGVVVAVVEYAPRVMPDKPEASTHDEAQP